MVFFPSSFTSRILNDQDASGLLTPPMYYPPLPLNQAQIKIQLLVRAAWGKGTGKEEGDKKYYTKPILQYSLSRSPILKKKVGGEEEGFTVSHLVILKKTRSFFM